MVEKVTDETQYKLQTTYKNGKVIFLFLGMVRESKGVYDLVKAASQIPVKHRYTYEIWIAGEGEVDKLNVLIEELALTDTVKYIGWLDGEKKTEAMRKASILVLPSYYEGSPVCILEALAYGMPVVSTDVGGIPELVQNNYNGFLSKPGEIEALRDNIFYFLNNRDQINVFGINSLKISTVYYKDSVLSSINDVYYNLLKISL
ncbi:glycosyltransferase [Pontibacter sp. H249]|uniref:glycosyltransferase n=1 Tax=Pontibacter sp. H249 TaxID=3133420 RepID=UPI0030C1C01B